MNKRIVLILIFLISLTIFLTADVYAIDGDDDKQDFGLDCNDNNYYIYSYAPQIPFDGIANDCRLLGHDGSLYDMDDPLPPSNGATYYLEDTIQLIGTDFFPNETYRIQISDADNRTVLMSGKITSIYSNDTVYYQTITADPSGNINVSVYLRSWHPDYGPGELHATGIWTVYIWFQAYNYALPGYFEWIPFETFTVVEPPLRLSIASPANDETYYTDGQFTGSVNLQVSANTELANKEIDTWWYSIDGAANKTFTPNTTIPNLNLGEHTVIVYANDTEGNISQKQSTFELWYSATDKDGDGQEPPQDCNDNIYYIFSGAVNIPYDGLWNDCDLRDSDSILYDINDSTYPSNNATYYLGETVTLTGNYFKPNTDIRVGIADTENRTERNEPGNRITQINTDDLVWQGLISINSTRGFNKAITLTNNTDHGLGVYTIYIWFESSTGGLGNREWIPVDTFTVVENHAPNATINNITGAENTNITFDLPENDSDGDPLTYSSDNPNIKWNGTHLYYETDYDTVIHPNLTKTITVNITADDTRLNYTQEVNITIIDVNRAPYFVRPPVPSTECNLSNTHNNFLPEDSAIDWTYCNYSMDTVVFDPDGDILNYSFYGWSFSPNVLNDTSQCKQTESLFTESACDWRHDPEKNMLQYKIAENYLGGCMTRINITDSYGLVYSNTDEFTLRLNTFTSYTEDAPILDITNNIFYEGEIADLGVHTIDFDCDTMNYTVNDSRFTWNGTNLFWDPTHDEIQHPNQSMNFSINVTGTDGKTPVSQIVNITLIDINRAPYFVRPSVPSTECNLSNTHNNLLPEDSAIDWTYCNYSMDTVVFDPDGDILNYSFYGWSFSPNVLNDTSQCKQTESLFTESACDWRHDPEKNMLQYKIAENYLGGCMIRINITDSYGLVYSNTSEFTLRLNTFTSSQDPPILNSPLPTITLFEDEYNDTWNPISYFNEYDCEPISFSIQDSANINSDNIIWNFSSITENWFGEENLTLTATDNIEDTIVNLTVRVLPVNDPVTLKTQVPDTSFDEDTTRQINFSAYFEDVDNTTFTYTLSQNTKISIYSIDGNQVTLIPTNNWNGDETITIHANDSEFEAIDSFKITINPINDAPTINTITDLTASERDKISLTPTASDIDNDSMTYYTNNSNLIWNTIANLFEWTPIYNQSGNHTINITVSDGNINDSTLMTIKVLDKYHRDDIELKQGWNMISYPYTLDNTSVADIMSGITSNYTIWTYDSSTELWSDYDSQKVAHLNNLTDITNADSFWLNISENENLTVIGTRPESVTINLNPGWNFISYPLDIQNPINTTLASIAGKYTIIWQYDAETGWSLYNPINLDASTIDNFMPGSGYWINLTESTTLTFSY